MNLNQYAINSVVAEEIKHRRQHTVSSLLPEGQAGDMHDVYSGNKLHIFREIMSGRRRTNDGHPLGGYNEFLQNGIRCLLSPAQLP